MSDLVERLRTKSFSRSTTTEDLLEAAAARIERLEAEAKEAGEHEVRACAERDQYLESNVKLAAELRQDRKRIERLKAALQPLAKLPLWRDKYNNGTDDLNTGGAVKFYFTVDDVRKARAALGDAVVPEIPEAIGRVMMRYLKGAV